MFVCTDCGAVFEEPDRWEERHGLDYGTFEKFSGCPTCGEPYVEAHKCNECGQWICGPYIKTDGGYRICENCYQTMDIGDED